MARDPLEAVIAALRGYAREKGRGVLAILHAGGQERVKINVKALYKYHDESTGYPLLEEALDELAGDPGRLEEIEARLVKIGRNKYIEIPTRLLEELVGQ